MSQSTPRSTGDVVALGEGRTRRKRRKWVGVFSIFLLVVVVVLAVGFAVSQNAEYRDLIIGLFTASDVPPHRPDTQVGLMVPTPTYTPTATAVVQVIPVMIEPTPTQEPTVEPTATATLVPTSVPTSTPDSTTAPTDYWIDDLRVRLIGERDGLIAVDFSVHLINVRGQDGSRPVLVEVAVDGGDRELIYIIKDMKIGEAIGFVFQRELTSGRHDVVFTVKDLVWSVTVDVEPTGVSFVAAPTATPTATPTPEPVDTPTPTVTLTPTPTDTALPTSTATPVPPRPTSTPAPATTLDLAVPPHLRHLEYKEYMLELINAERISGGLDPVVLGDNSAAQLHAEFEIEHCFNSHWGIDGLKPYMRYTACAGGYQSNGENGHSNTWTVRTGGATWTGDRLLPHQIRQWARTSYGWSH